MPKSVAMMRAAMLEGVSHAEMTAIAKKLVTMALAGDVTAAVAVMDRVLGKPKITADVNVSGMAFIEQLHSLRAAPQFLRQRDFVDQPNGTVNGSSHRDDGRGGSQDAPNGEGEEDSEAAE